MTQPATTSIAPNAATARADGTKTCPDCKRELPHRAFVKNPKGRDGLQTYCRECSATRSRNWAVKNRDAVLARKRQYYNEKKAEILEKQRAHYEANKAVILEQQRRPPEVNRDHVKAWARHNPEKRKAQMKRQTDRLTDGYVRRKLTAKTKMKAAEIPQSLVELKRIHLLMLRHLKEEGHENR